jgi:GNAT superfamily N-acetyltransferase
MNIVYTSVKDDPRGPRLLRGLDDYNDRAGPPEHWEWLALYAETDNGELLGGIHGQFEWDYLLIKHLWVARQRSGLGSTLLRRAEEMAAQKGKKGVWLDTFDSSRGTSTKSMDTNSSGKSTKLPASTPAISL